MKKLVLGLASLMSVLWRIVPKKMRHSIITGFYILESRGKPSDGLRNLFDLENKLNWVINERAMAYGGGEHPKHRLTRYHDFFIDRLEPGAHVLDIGCGYGAVARSIATRVPGSRVVGIDLDKKRLGQAKNAKNPGNLEFIEADARKDIPEGTWDTVILSNILEHIEDRTGFLADVISQARPNQILIRVPLFERSWKMAMRRELGVNYFSDEEHFIEHQLSEFRKELEESSLQAAELQTLWGEIWARCVPVKADA